VLQPAEWRHGHIRGSQNLPLLQLKSQLAKLPREKTIVTVCASGHRSHVAARTLQRAGYQVENLKGGMHAWTKAGLPIEKRPSSPAASRPNRRQTVEQLRSRADATGG
jgi:rhodanese-related sulfurtransferase